MNATAWATFWVFLGFLVFIGIAHLHEGAGEARRGARRSAPPRSRPTSKRRGGSARRRRRCSPNTSAGAARPRRRPRRSSTQAQREAEALADEARARIEDYVTRRTKAVEQRIAQAETQAVAEVRSRAIDVAAAAASRILAEEAKGKKGDELVERSIAAVRSNLN